MMKKSLLHISFLLFPAFSVLAQAPIIHHIEPPAAIPGSTVTLHGFNFETTPASNTVTFAGVTATVTSATINQLIVTVPAATTGPGDVIITNANGTSVAFTFIIIAAPSPGVFGNQNTVTTTADGAWSVFAADLDGDGDMDVLSASFNDDKIAWYENDGAGGFTLPASSTITTTADGAWSVYATDLDGDGDMDVLSASYLDDKVAWYENTDGAGGFGTQQVISTIADGARSVYATDLDGDGDMDVLSASLLDDKIAWYENTDGLGGFGTQQVISTGANGAHSVYVADLDGDGDMDVLSASQWDDKIAWYKNDGAGGFGTQRVITTTANYAISVYGADLDGDGDMDVLSASTGDDKIAWYENTDGAGGFGTEQVITTAENEARSVYATDLDGDGDMDVLSASSINDKIAWYKNDGVGVFTVQPDISTTADWATSVYAADLDGDGDMDVLSGSFSDDKIAWYANHIANITSIEPSSAVPGNSVKIYGNDINLNTTTVTFSGTPGIVDIANSTASVLEVAVPDIIPGLADVVLTTPISSYTSVQAPTNFTILSSIPRDTLVVQPVITSTAVGAVSVYAADLDGDGDMDVLSASQWDDKIAWYQNDGAGGFGTQQVITTGDNAMSVYAADLDGDGDMDVLSASWDFSVSKIAWYKNDGAGGFGTQKVITTTAIYANSVYAADLDGDGDMDVLSASWSDDKIAWYKNDGAGVFGTQQVITIGADQAYSVYAADLDGDGDMDVLSASIMDDKIAWYKNDGAGGFTAQSDITTTADGANSVYAADLDGDGDMDVLSASVTDDKIAWYQNNGAGGFGVQQIITANAQGAKSVYATDMDGDGDMDVLSASATDDKVAWYENTDGMGGFGAQQIITTNAQGAWSVYTADLDNDGDMDVLSASVTDDKIAWYKRSFNGNDILTFTIAEETANKVIDNANSSVVIEVANGIDLTTINPSYTLSLGTTVLISSTDYSGEVTYTVTSELGVSRDWLVNVIPVTDAPVLSLTTTDQTTAGFSWNQPAYTQGYKLEVSTDAAFSGFISGYPKSITDAVTLNESLTGLTAGTRYYVRIRSYNQFTTESANSTTLTILTIPANPSATAAAGITSISFQATWNAVGGADYYILEVSSDDFSTTILQDTVTNQLFADVTGLSAGTEYKYRVQSGNATGVSGVSNIVTVTTSANVAPLSLNLTYSGKFPDGQTSATITVSTSGGSGNLSMAIRSKGILAVSFDPDQTLTANSNGDYEFIVTSDMLDEMGVEFEVEATDASNDSDMKTGMIFRSFDEAQSPPIPFEKFGGTDNTWNLFSIPYALDNKSISTIFADYDPTRFEFDWKIMRYRNSSNDYVNFNTGQVKAGEAYWFNAKEKIAVKTGAGQVVSQIPFSMGLVQGWNLVGNPYNVSISWNSVIASNGEEANIEPIYMYIPGSVSFQQGDVIQPFSGGFVWAEAATTVSISPVNNSSGLRMKSEKIVNRNIDEPEWILPITLKNRGVSFQQIAVGMHPDAREGKDEFDQMTLPRFFNYLEMYSNHEGYFYPWFSEDITPTAGEYLWRFTMESNFTGVIVVLEWDQSVIRNSTSALLLVDEIEGRIIDMKEAGQYEFRFSEQRNFTVYYSLDPSKSILPSSILLGDAYPNPASSATVIPVTLPDVKDRYHISLEVYNMQGQVIKTLASGRYDPGFYEFEWEGNSEKSTVPDGIYLYRLVFEDPDIDPIQKRLIIQR